MNVLEKDLHLIKGFDHTSTDIGKTFGPLPDRRTSDHMENPSFTGLPKLLQDLPVILFFQHKSPHRGAPYRNFLPDMRTGTTRVFMGPPLFLLVEDRGLVDFPMSASSLAFKHSTLHPAILM